MTNVALRTSRTTTAGGIGTAFAGLMAVLASLRFVLPLMTQYSLLFGSFIPVLVAAVVLLASMCVLAFGFPGEQGIVGRSILGRTGLVVFGLSWLVFNIDGTITPFGVGVTSSDINSVLSVLFAAAAMIGAISIVRAGVLSGFARWALLIVAICDAAVTALMLVPDAPLVLALATWQVGLLIPLTLIAAGLSYLLQGRSATISQRVHTVNDAWRQTTSI
jgi:hypothetical protein